MIHIIESFPNLGDGGVNLPVIYNPVNWRCRFADTERVIYAVSKSRAINSALAYLEKDYCLITDLKLTDPEYTRTVILRYYGKYDDADVIIFQLSAPQAAEQPSYFQFEKQLELYDLQFISNCMISFKSTPVREKQIRFDENFGPGSRFAHYEDKVFLADLLHAGLKLIYIPDTNICKTISLVFKAQDYLRMLKSLGSALLRIYGIEYILEYIALSMANLEEIETRTMIIQEVPLYKIETLLQGAVAYSSNCSTINNN